MNKFLMQSFTDDNAIATNGLYKDFRTSTALDDVSVAVPTGAVYLLVGPNGAGKTTLLRILLDDLRPTRGGVEVLGHDPSRRGAWVRAATGYVPENGIPAYRWMRIGELLRYHAAYYTSWDSTYADHLVDALSIRLDARFGSLSKGEARRVQLVMALAHKPRLLLLDEPTDGLDPLIRDRFFALLAEHLAETPTTILISSHLVYESELFADHLGVLGVGKLRAQLGRPTLDAMLRRYTAQSQKNLALDASLSDRVLQSRQLSGGTEWVIWGDESEVTERLSAAGALISDVRRLSLADTVTVLMDHEEVRS